jgi:hypothetical protein
VQSAVAHGLHLLGERGKHTVLDHHREQQILDRIQQNAEQSTRVSKAEIKDYCTGQLKVQSLAAVNSLVLRHPDKIIKTKSILQEQQRLRVPRMFLERTQQSMT